MNPTPQVHIGGASPSPTEVRDVLNLHTLASLPPKEFDADFSKIPVQMQYQIGDCTAEAVCTLIERFRNDGVVLSRRFTYMVGKKLIDGNLIEGSAIKSMLHGAYKYGTQPESVVPSDRTVSYAEYVSFNLPAPTKEGEEFFIYVNGNKSQKIPGYVSVPVDDMASGICQYGGLAVRFDCGSTWWTDIFGNVTWDALKITPLRRPAHVVSGHAVVAIAYDESETTYRNSWSEKWALGGNGYAVNSQYRPTEAYGILKEAPVIPTLPLKFTKQMGYGSIGTQVFTLQETLIRGGYASFTKPTGFFGNLTQQAVKNYQKKWGIPTTGYVGVLTLARLNT